MVDGSETDFSRTAGARRLNCKGSACIPVSASGRIVCSSAFRRSRKIWRMGTLKGFAIPGSCPPSAPPSRCGPCAAFRRISRPKRCRRRRQAARMVARRRRQEQRSQQTLGRKTESHSRVLDGRFSGDCEEKTIPKGTIAGSSPNIQPPGQLVWPEAEVGPNGSPSNTNPHWRLALWPGEDAGAP